MWHKSRQLNKMGQKLTKQMHKTSYKDQEESLE